MGSRSVRSATVGPPAARHDDNHDLEAPVATFVRSAVASTTIPVEEEKVVADADSGQDSMKTQISVMTLMKIVSPGTGITFPGASCRHLLKTVELAVSMVSLFDRHRVPVAVCLAEYCILHLIKAVSIK